MMKNPFRVLIITCWILLGLCCIAKLFGANWFTPAANNKNFIDACNYVETSFWYYIISATFNIITTSIYLMAVLKQNKPDIRWLIPLIIYAILKSIFHTQTVLFFILDIAVIMLGIPLLINHKLWLRIVLGVLINVLFQYISLYLKLDNYKVFGDNVLISLILSIDYVIMLVLFWLYSIRKIEEREVA